MWLIITPREIITNPLGSINQFQGAAKDLADELDYLKGKTARATAGAGLAVSIPNDVLSVAFMAKGAHGRVSSSIDQQDIDYLRRIQRSNVVAAGVALDAALNGTDQITKNLNSTASGRAAIVSDYGVAARQFDLGGVPVSVGVTPKLQKTWVYNYTTSIYDYDSNKWNDSRYRTDDTGFNVDAGIAPISANTGPCVSGQNLMSRDIDTKDIRIRNGGRSGEL
jgi:hypothetical protein